MSDQQYRGNLDEVRRKPLVSVITIFLNAEEFILEAIESVFAQTHENWELLLVDDGSTDSSTKIARRCAEQHSERVRYLEHCSHANRGMSSSRNLGIHNAKGEYIALLDADDVWLPHKLEQQVALLEAQPEAGMVYGASQYWYSWSRASVDLHRDYIPSMCVTPNSLVRPPAMLKRCLRSQAPPPCPSNVLLRRQAVETVGGFEEVFRGLFEDQAFFSKIFLHTPVFVAGQCWDRYRQHANSCVSLSTKATTKEAGLFYLSWLESYLSDQGVHDTEIWHALRFKQWRYRHPTLTAALRHPLRALWQIAVRIARRLLPAPVRRWARACWEGGGTAQRGPGDGALDR